MPRNIKFDQRFHNDSPMGPNTLCFLYDFSVLGGAVSAITLKGADGAALTIPDNAVITGAWVEGITDLTSGGSATVALGYTGAATALVAATAKAHATWDVDAVTALALTKTTAEVSVLATVATAALTAGKFYVWVQYVRGA